MLTATKIPYLPFFLTLKKTLRRIIHFFSPILSFPLRFKRMNISERDVQRAVLVLEKYHPNIKSSCIKKDSNIHDRERDLNIIIPAYNVENYLPECLESVFNQKTQYQYRVILVDDGSQDSTGEIAEKLKENHHNLIVIHQKNQGLSSARNTALEYLDSRYVLFLDSDDYLIGSNAIQLLLSEAIKENADIVQAGIKKCDNDGRFYGTTAGAYKGNISKDNLHGFACGKVIKSEFFHHIIFPVGYLFEDSVMRHIIFPKVNILRGIDKALYAYRYNPQSLTHANRCNKKCIDTLWITLQLNSDRKKIGIEDSLDYYEYLLRMACRNASRVSKLPEEIQKSVFIVYADFIKKQAFFGKSKNNAQMEYALSNGCYGLYKLIARLGIGIE